MSVERTGTNSRLLVVVHPGKRADRLYLVDQVAHVDLIARAIGGQANEALLRFLGKRLSIAPSLLSIRRGLTSHHKEVLVVMAHCELMERIRKVALS